MDLKKMNNHKLFKFLILKNNKFIFSNKKMKILVICNLLWNILKKSYDKLIFNKNK